MMRGEASILRSRRTSSSYDAVPVARLGFGLIFAFIFSLHCLARIDKLDTLFCVTAVFSGIRIRKRKKRSRWWWRRKKEKSGGVLVVRCSCWILDQETIQSLRRGMNKHVS